MAGRCCPGTDPPALPEQALEVRYSAGDQRLGCGVMRR